MSDQEPVTYYSEQQVAELLHEQSKHDWLQASLMLGQGHTRIIKRLHLQWGITAAIALALGIGGGVFIERQAVVKPCVQALDAYRDGFGLLEEVARTTDPTGTESDFMARAGALGAVREPAERRCRG